RNGRGRGWRRGPNGSRSRSRNRPPEVEVGEDIVRSLADNLRTLEFEAGSAGGEAVTSRPLFTVEERDRIRARLLEIAHADPRVVAGADVGSLATGRGDRWSALALTFGLAEDASAGDLLADWSRDLEFEFGAVALFDLPFLSTIYRVFLFPGNLQVDLSFTP